MSCLSVNIQQRFTNLRKKLDQLGYMQPLSIDCLPLVENLFTDFVWTTDSFRKCKFELDKRMDVRDRLEDYIDPYKKDNGRLLNENNRLQKKIMETKIEYEERMRDLQCQIRHLDEEKEDLRMFNQQCLEKLKKYEVEAKSMVDKIMHLQEKNFQAVVHMPDGAGKRKPIAFRRQRMDIDFLIPRIDHQSSDSANGECHARPTFDSSTSPSTSERADLLESVTNKCQELAQQLRCATEQVELNERKNSSYADQLALYEDEIGRLTRELSGGRSVEALTVENQQRCRDRVQDQLNMQIDLLQQRNEELEKEIIRCNAINIKEGRSMGGRDKSCNKYESDCTQEQQNRKLISRIEEIMNREKCILKELHSANNRALGRQDDCIPTMSDNLQREIDALQCHIQSLESDRNYWKEEAECKSDNIKKDRNRKSMNDSEETSDKLSNGNGSTDIDELHKEIKHYRYKLKGITAENNELKQMLDAQERNLSPPVKDKDHSRQAEGELKKVRMERDSLQCLLDKFERQLHDIQGNIRVLTQERDMINERYEECQRELHQMRELVIQSDNPRRDNSCNLTAQNVLRRLEMEKDDTVNDLHRMTTERDSLRERLKAVTETGISEKARICQRLEDCENQICKLTTEKEEMITKMSILRNKLGEMEEQNHQLMKKYDSLSCVLEKERETIQALNTDLLRFENEVEKKERRESQLSEELKNTENRISTLQERLESYTIENEDQKNESIKLKEIISELDSEKDQMQAEVDEKIEQLRDSKMQLKVKEDALNDIRVNMTSLEQQLRRIHEVNNHRDQELRALVVHNEQLENDLRHQVSRNDQMKSENTRLEEDLMCLTRDFQKLETEFRESRRCIIEINQEKDQLEERISHFQKTGCDQQNQNQELLEQYRQLSLDNDRLQLEWQKSEGNNDDLRREIDARESIISRMRDQLLQAEREISSSESNIHNLEDQIRNLNQVMENNEQVTENHSMEKHEILEELAAMRDLCSRLENSKENAQRQLSSRLLEFEQVKAENCGLFKENENLREEIDSLHENIRNMETVMSVGREKGFMNELEFQQRIAELESVNEQLGQMPSKNDQLQHEMKKCMMRCCELESECEKLRRQLTSERFKSELANQELRRRQKSFHNGACTDRAVSVLDNRECFNMSGRPLEPDYNRTDCDLSDHNELLTPTGFYSDRSIDSEILCNHGCYHGRDCNNALVNDTHSMRCGRGCRHSETCLERINRRKEGNRRRRNKMKSRALLNCLTRAMGSHHNSNNHGSEKTKTEEKQHLNPNCPFHKPDKEISNDGVSTKEGTIEKLDTIPSESEDKVETINSIDTDEDRNSSESDNDNPSESISEEKTINIEIPEQGENNGIGRKAYPEAYQLHEKTNVKLSFHALHPLSVVGPQSTENNDHFKNLVNAQVPKANVDLEISHLNRLNTTLSQRILIPKISFLQPIPLQASYVSNDTMFSKISKDTYSTKNLPFTSTLAQVPSIGQSYETPSDINNDDHISETQLRLRSDHNAVDQDPTDVSESLSHSFYNLSSAANSANNNSSSGVDTGRSFNTHTPTMPVRNNNSDVPDADTRLASDRTEESNAINLDESSGS